MVFLVFVLFFHFFFGIQGTCRIQEDICTGSWSSPAVCSSLSRCRRAGAATLAAAVKTEVPRRRTDTRLLFAVHRSDKALIRDESELLSSNSLGFFVHLLLLVGLAVDLVSSIDQLAALGKTLYQKACTEPPAPPVTETDF